MMKTILKEAVENSTFIYAFNDFILDRVPTNPLWSLSLSLSVLSTAIGNNMVFETMRGPLQLNLNILFIGPSGIAEKTIPLENYGIPTMENLQKSIEERRFLIPNVYTSEGLKEYFSYEQINPNTGRVQKRDCGIIFYDEFAQFFSDLKSKRYMRDAMYTLTNLYGGRLPSHVTRKHSFEPENYVCVNFVAASSNHVLKVLDPEFFVQGCGNRFLYILSDIKVLKEQMKKPRDAHRYFDQLMARGEREEWLERYSSVLKDFHLLSKFRLFFLKNKIREFLDRFEISQKHLSMKILEKDAFDLRASYIVRKPEFVYKLMCLKAIDRALLFLEIDDPVDIKLEDVKWAINLVEKYYDQFIHLLDYWKEVIFEEQSEVRLKDPSHLLHILSKNGGYMQRHELRKKANSAGITSYRYNDCLNILRSRGELIQVEAKEDSSKTGPVPTWYIAVAFLDMIPKWLKEAVQQARARQATSG